jgi:hypothetical protein
MLLIGTLSAIADHVWIYLASLLLAGLIGIGLNYMFLRRYVSGLMFLQISFIFNTAIVLFGWITGALSLFRVAHFFFYQLTAVIGIYWVYCWVLRNRARIFERLRQLNVTMVSAILVSFNLAMFGLFFCFVVQNEGASRIEFMTAGWFSFFRPVMSILTPLSFFVPLYLLDGGHRSLPLSILASSVMSNIASGSKASFVFGILGALLLYQDLKGARLIIPRALGLFLLIAMSLSAVFALERLDVDLAALSARFIRFGESTILVYYAEDPSVAATGVSTLAKIHRGAAKLLGDGSAADIDTAFGFALSREDNGAHNFTGPNAQISSYMLCNYSGWENLIGLASIFGYLAVVTWFIEYCVHRQGARGVVLLPFAVASLNGFLQDYYQGMSDVTLMLMAIIAFALLGITTLACRGVSIVHEPA